MEEQEKPAADGEKIPQQNHPDPLPSAPPQVAKPESPVPQQPATAQQLEQVEEKMSAFERSTLNWARVAVIVSGFAFVVVCAQWWEMHTSGIDTHNLAVAARNQAMWTQRLAGSAGTQADSMKDQIALSRQQLSASDGAVVTLTPGWQNTLHVGINTLVTSLANRGRATPTGIHSELKVIWETIPYEIPIRSADPLLVIDRGVVVPTPDNEYGARITYPISISAKELEAIQAMRMTIFLKGTLRYWNGFENREDPLCFAYLDLIFKDKTGFVVSSSQPDFRPCAEYDSNIRIWVSTKREWETKDWRQIQNREQTKPN